jgi:hypothetical protein
MYGSVHKPRCLVKTTDCDLGGQDLIPGRGMIFSLCDRANRPENLNVQPEEEVDEDHKGPHI